MEIPHTAVATRSSSTAATSISSIGALPSPQVLSRRNPRGVNGDPCASISANGNHFHYKIIMYPKGIDGDVDIEEFHADFVAAYQDIAHKLLQGLDEYPLLQCTARFKNPVSIKKLARS